MKLSKDELLQLLMRKAVGIISEEDNALADDLLTSNEEAIAIWNQIQKLDQRNQNSRLFTPMSRSQGWEEVISTVKRRRRRRFIIIIGIISIVIGLLLLTVYLISR